VRIQDLEYRPLGHRVYGLGFKVYCLGCKINDSDSELGGPGFRTLVVGLGTKTFINIV
jgi:hypothetical protein